ncbi:MAG TPA: amidase family protein, partial [Paraburkholderia sp.]|nr:amidase family protein [Paraburkholderia sp.]
PADVISRSLVRRTTLVRQWRLFLDQYAVVLMPVSGELPFPDDLDQRGPEGFDRVWDAQLTMRALPAMGLPGLAVTTQLVNGVPVGVQIVAAHFREDLCLLAGEAIEARGVPVSPVDPIV